MIKARMTLLATLIMGSTALAEGRVISPDELSPAVRVKFAEQIALAHQQHPDAFIQVKGVVANADELDRQKRGRMAALSPILRQVGEAGLWPMVEVLAFSAPAAGPTRPSSALALDLGLVEAAGMLRDGRLAPLWLAILDGAEERPGVVRAAAGALARLETAEASAKLIALSRSEGLRREAALAMMGHCRRLTVARALADELEARPEPALARTVIQSLADVGSSWAWQTPAVKHRSEEGAVRRVAAEALVRAYLAYDGEVRQAASNALLVVDAPQTPSLLSAARSSATAEQREALDALVARFARNPAR